MSEIKIKKYSHKGHIYADCDDRGQLKSCPFCGKEGIIEGRGSDYNYDYILYSVGCIDRKCIGHYMTHIYIYDTPREALEAWNRRANDD